MLTIFWATRRAVGYFSLQLGLLSALPVQNSSVRVAVAFANMCKNEYKNRNKIWNVFFLDLSPISTGYCDFNYARPCVLLPSLKVLRRSMIDYRLLGHAVIQ